MDHAINMANVVNSLVFSAVGILTLILAFVFADVITPRTSLWKEVIEKQNLALAILLGCFLIGVALIIAAAVHG